MNSTIAIAPVRKTLRVKVPPPKAFEVFTASMERWWPKSHSVNKSPIERIVIEPRIGGRWFERGEYGTECQWGRVLAWEPPRRLLLAWQLTAQWQFDPAFMTEVEVCFIAEGDGTRVEFEHRNLERYGETADSIRQSIGSDEGWPGILLSFAQAVDAGG